MRSQLRGEVETFQAENGKQALAVLQSAEIDLIISDLKMPEMDGVELLARLTTERLHTPVIFISGYPTSSIEKLLYENGAIKILSKPLVAETLLPQVRESLDWAANRGSMSGISLDNFLQFISWERKTCLVEIENDSEEEPPGKGHFYFRSGELYDAFYGGLEAEEAVFAMLSLPRVRIFFREIKRAKVSRRIQWTLTSLLMEGVRRRDELKAFGRVLGPSEGMTSEDLPGSQKQPSEESAPHAAPEAEGSAGSSPQEEPEPWGGIEKEGMLLGQLPELRQLEDLLGAGLFRESRAVDFLGIERPSLSGWGAGLHAILKEWRQKDSRHQLGGDCLFHLQTSMAHILVKRVERGEIESGQAPSGMEDFFLVLAFRPECNLVLAKRKLESFAKNLKEKMSL